MDVSHILHELNDAQRDAVASEPGPMLVLAGAGSGKTRVLTHRVSWLVGVEKLSPLSIMAVTFTNKAAQEMRGRIETLLGFPVGGMWMGTFHGLSHRLLRAHYQESGLPKSFQILDSDDQYRMVRRTLKNLELDEAYWPPRQVAWFINSHKEEGRRSAQLGQSDDSQQRQMIAIYHAYEQACLRSGLVDFAELLLRAYELVRDNASLREHYQDRFRHLLVDEFQDTNTIQYAWLKLLSGGHRNLFAVGDDDQSIYGWRGARVENILRFEQDFPGTRVIRLEQNYRSTSTILEAANAVIRHNSDRMGKNLWTDGGEGEPLRLYAACNEYDEARFVIEHIQEWLHEGHVCSECAILYRSNAQSRVFEEILLQSDIPYRVYGGLRFFERQEIKDALAYLRLMDNPKSDAAFERIVNVPARGMGAKTLEAIRGCARTQALSMWEASVKLRAAESLPARARRALNGFLGLISDLSEQVKGLTLLEQVSIAIDGSGLRDRFQKEKGEKAAARLENLDELISAAGHYAQLEHDELEPLASFLAHASLEAGEGQGESWEDCVQLMSLHSAKGLEFPLVFLTGLEEGLFPHDRAVHEDGRLEEERRLCYVGMTRAMKQLYITYAEVRRLHGNERYTSPSRFLGEIPDELLQELRGSRRDNTRVLASAVGIQPPSLEGISLGQRVIHHKFGEGTVMNVEGQGQHARVQVNFTEQGAKWLVLAYANLEHM